MDIELYHQTIQHLANNYADFPSATDHTGDYFFILRIHYDGLIEFTHIGADKGMYDSNEFSEEIINTYTTAINTCNNRIFSTFTSHGLATHEYELPHDFHLSLTRYTTTTYSDHSQGATPIEVCLRGDGVINGFYSAPWFFAQDSYTICKYFSQAFTRAVTDIQHNYLQQQQHYYETTGNVVNCRLWPFLGTQTTEHYIHVPATGWIADHNCPEKIYVPVRKIEYDQLPTDENFDITHWYENYLDHYLAEGYPPVVFDNKDSFCDYHTRLFTPILCDFKFYRALLRHKKIYDLVNLNPYPQRNPLKNQEEQQVMDQQNNE